MIELLVSRHVPRYVQSHARRIVAKLPEVMRIEHPIELYIAAVVEWPDAKVPYIGGFIEPREMNPCRIAVAGYITPFVKEHGRQAAMDDFTDTLIHEFVHYEQWRDGRHYTERGVARRTKAVMQQLGGR